MSARKLILPSLVLASGAGAHFYLNRPPTAQVLTGIVTTNDVVVSPQIGGRLEKLIVSEGDAVKRDQLIAMISPDELQAESS